MAAPIKYRILFQIFYLDGILLMPIERPNFYFVNYVHRQMLALARVEEYGTS